MQRTRKSLAKPPQLDDDDGNSIFLELVCTNTANIQWRIRVFRESNFFVWSVRYAWMDTRVQPNMKCEKKCEAFVHNENVAQRCAFQSRLYNLHRTCQSSLPHRK